VPIRVFSPETPTEVAVYQTESPKELLFHFTDNRRTTSEYSEELEKVYVDVLRKSFPKLEVSALSQPPIKLTPNKSKIYLHITQTDYHVLRKPAKWIARVNLEIQLFIIENNEVKQFDHSLNQLATRPTRRGLHGAKQALQMAFSEACKQLPTYIQGCLTDKYQYIIIESGNTPQSEAKTETE
jgi:hypothetical protein